ncbi:MAG TPA: DeoR/GlpR family DNA-binding transcription regulator [Alphaproteobacteria bacterium]|nr:DeoR/GlpR family DNA-binding transcription regulator [Alphaproteobacteria bacterium]
MADHDRNAAVDSRHLQIVEMVRAQGFVSVEHLADALGVTPQTIRRDIKALDGRGLLIRHHGGVRVPISTENTAYRSRSNWAVEEKRRIARLVAEHVPDDSSVFINIGTTTEEVARALLARSRLRVVTNNIHVAMTLMAKPDFEIVMAGGLLRNKDGGIVGEAAVEFMAQFRADIGIIGVSGIDRDGALLDFDFREVRVAQTIIARSRKVFLVADRSKFGRSAMVQICDMARITALFTDGAVPEPYRSAILAGGTSIVEPGMAEAAAAL